MTMHAPGTRQWRPYDARMQNFPDTDSDDFADLMDFIATSGRTRNGAFVTENAEKLVNQMWAGRAQAMTQSLVAVANAAMHANR
jgi:hypothetical protein